ncbi:MAG: M43 family zinc metalloprotease [Chitinophagales bacterium]|nr:T9SS type A sorting domain-containing protein [Bacteroidota bacterium]
MKKLLLVLAIIASSSLAFAQDTLKCGNTERDNYLLATDPIYAANRKSIEDFTAKYLAKQNNTGAGRSGEVIVIPCVIHVVYKNATENITDEQAYSQIEALNLDFRRLNPDASETPAEFASVASDLEIEFCIATVDPEGNPTNGIVRVSTAVPSFSTSDDIKYTASGGSDAWPADEYLNLWCGDLGSSLLGYAQFPGGADATDGVVVNYTAFGTEGTVIAPYNLGRTASHEVGHWLNLLHIWGDDGGGCGGSDFCDDTPNQAGENYGCPTYPLADDCSESVQFQNFMDYTDDACYNMFTEDQKSRAQALFAPGGARYDLGNSLKCVAYDYDVQAVQIITPVGTYCYSTFNPVIEIRNIGFADMTSCEILYSVDGATATTYYWTGLLGTYEAEEVTLPSISLGDGAHTLSITVQNPSGFTDENIVNNFISGSFFINTFGLTLPLIQGFETTGFPYTGYTVTNPDGTYTWERTTAAAKTGSASVFMNYYDYSAYGAVDELSMPAYNMSGVTAAYLNFDVAYANYSPDGEYSDSLQVLVSSDCGVTWTSIYYKSFPELNTAPSIGSAFIPSQDQWRTEGVSLTPYVGDKLVVKFRAVCQWENNMYLDNINIASGTLAVNNMDNNAWIEVYPNPAMDWLNITFNISEDTEADIQIVNMLGEVVYTDAVKFTPGMINQSSLPVMGLPSGYYSIRIIGNHFSSSRSFIKQ